MKTKKMFFQHENVVRFYVSEIHFFLKRLLTFSDILTGLLLALLSQYISMYVKLHGNL